MTKRNSVVYRYYTCSRAIKRGRRTCKHPSLPAVKSNLLLLTRLREISRDSNLRDEIVRQAIDAMQQERIELESHHVQITRQLARRHGEIRELALDQKSKHFDRSSNGRHTGENRKAEHELSKVKPPIERPEKQQLTTEEIQEAFIDFARIWDALTASEQSQLLSLLVSRIEFDQSDCTIAITFHASGIETLEQQSQEV